MKNQVLTGDVKDEGFAHFFTWDGANNIASCKCGANQPGVKNAKQLKTWGLKHLADVRLNAVKLKTFAADRGGC